MYINLEKNNIKNLNKLIYKESKQKQNSISDVIKFNERAVISFEPRAHFLIFFVSLLIMRAASAFYFPSVL